MKLLPILFAHYICDFVLQTRWMATNKSKRTLPLVVHVLSYSFGMSVLLFPFMGWYSIPYAWFNGATHLVIDAVTSRISAHAYSKGQHRLFWATIGFDQFLHIAILLSTLPMKLILGVYSL